MTYVDVTLTPAATYTYVHNGQIYDQIATTLAAHSNWQYVEYVDAISGADTYRRHVWKCKAAGTGLPSDFYVMFQTKFTTATGVYATGIALQVMLSEGYTSGTMSKMASINTTITPASDMTNPATWALSTYSAPASVYWVTNSRQISLGPSSNLTSVRMLYIVAKDGLMSNWSGLPSAGATTASENMYVGMYDTLLGANDPMPIVLTPYTSNGTTPVGGATRAPLQTAGVAGTEVYSTTFRTFPGAGGTFIGTATKNPGASSGTLGLASDTNWAKSDGYVQAFRCYLSSYTATPSTNSTKGFIRGYMKYVRGVALSATHNAGDTFLIDGKVHLGLGGNGQGFWDTTAV